MYVKEIASELKVDPRTVGTIIREAFDSGYITRPQIRRRSYANMKEYVYFINCKDPLEVYLQYSKDMNVVYHAAMNGFANMMIIAQKKFDPEGEIVVEGYLSDYYFAFAPNHSWEKAVQIMQKKVQNLSVAAYEPKKTIKTRWTETVSWDSEDEMLFREFKYDLRKPLTAVMKKHLISTTKIYQWFKRLPECCTIFTRYFPEGVQAYDPNLFMFETDYEDFIIELFSELPTSSYFFKVSDKLFLSARITRTSLRKPDLDASDIAQMWIPFLLKNLKKKGVLKEESHSTFEYHWKKGI
ncbi:MAG: hypothetical protein HXS44_11595 [Theionarchaea archaeon]|nr:hypothetical protein [Theionarchaea archaeon]